ncbi:MAG: hypothetical protein M1812_003891 [Candelaria pacifica]|nr:MAG: hypothetical protein M1812_003891 [Candelaria pacifica]
MRRRTLHLSLINLILALLTLTAAFPLDNPSSNSPPYTTPVLESRQSTMYQKPTPDKPCTDKNQNLRTECWDQLGVTAWLDTWWQDNFQSKCVPNGWNNFFQCFLEVNGLHNKQNCNVMDDGTGLCPIDRSSINLIPGDVRIGYVVMAISTVNQWFTSINRGLKDAQTHAQGSLGAIVQYFNPPKTENHLLSEILVAVGAAVGSIPFPAIMAGKIIGEVVTQIATSVMQQLPGVLKYLYPKTTIDSVVTQISDISSHLDDLVQQTSQNIAAVLAVALNDQATFKSFTANGAFVAPEIDLSQQTIDLTRTLNTYVISRCLKGKGIFLSGAWYTNPHDMTVNGSLADPSYMACATYTADGICSAWWWDAEQNNAYGLVDSSNNPKNFYDDMNWIIPQYTSGELLFRGAKECADYVHAGGSNEAVVDVNLQPKCVSSIDYCVYNQQMETDWSTRGKSHDLFTQDYPASTCDDKGKNFRMLGCGNGGNKGQGISAPAAYLGPYMLNQNAVGWDFGFCHK